MTLTANIPDDIEALRAALMAEHAARHQAEARATGTAKRTVDEACRRTRAVTRRLRDVEELDAPTWPALLDLVMDKDAQI